MTKKTSWRKDAITLISFCIIAVIVVLSFNQMLSLGLRTNSPLVVVISGSMEPTYYGSTRTENDLRKDMLIVQGAEPSTIKVGDVIVFNYINHTVEDIPIVHRVTRVYQDNETGDYWFSTKGDNPYSNNGFAIPEVYYGNLRIDELNIHESRLVGKIVGRIPYLGGIYSYFQGEQGKYVLIIGTVIIFIATIASSLLKRDKTTDEKGISRNKKMHDFYLKLKKQKHFILPGLMLLIIILIPIIDTVSADWGSDFGIIDLEYKKYYTKSHILPGEENETAIITHVTINNPGHWHQVFKKFTLQIQDNTSQIIGKGTWTSVSSFEGEKTVSICTWVDTSLLLNGVNYSITATAFLNSKFGRTRTQILEEFFIFEIDY